jgi:hypothetical protein
MSTSVQLYCEDLRRGRKRATRSTREADGLKQYGPQISGIAFVLGQCTVVRLDRERWHG